MTFSAEDQLKRGIVKTANGQMWYVRDDDFCGEVRFALVNGWWLGGARSANAAEESELGGTVVALELDHWDIPLIWMPAEAALELGEALVESAKESLSRAEIFP